MAYNSTPANVYTTLDYTASTIDRRDVSEMLELWAHKDTPFLNRLSWGAETGARSIEWVHEHLGFGFVYNSAAVGSGGTSLVITAIGSATAAEQAKQIHPGTALFVKGVADSGAISGDIGWFLVSAVDASGTLTGAWNASTKCSVAADTAFYIAGSFAQEGSIPDRDTSRTRTLLSNGMAILRQDVRITGSQMATDMHAVANELQHQTKLRLLEMQRDRQMAVLFSKSITRAAGTIGSFAGIAELMVDNATLDTVDIATSSLTETGFNNLVAYLAENGGTPNVAVGSVSQIRKFTGWSADRVRSRVDDRVGGQYITSYLTDTGLTLDLLSVPHFPANCLFVLNTDDFKPRAKSGRKLMLEKLGKVGDYDEWQLLSEFSLEHHGIADGKNGAFLGLS